MLRAADAGKDQTYALYMASQDELAHTRWPVGEYTKSQVREMAAERGLITARKPDSYDICFIPEGDVAGFLEARLGARPGAIVGPDGAEMARHDGAYRFTVGQRRGLGIAGKPEPLFVTAITGDTVHVGPRAALETAGLVATDVSWVAGSPPPAGSPLAAQVRYRGESLPVDWDLTDDGRLHVMFGAVCPFGVAPGQAVVLYDGEECVGGATIVSATPARTTADSAAGSYAARTAGTLRR
jgi:tRNA-specific 2-thiouridylase